VFHLAAIHFIPYCDAHPSETLLVNVVGTQLVLDALALVPDARLVFASTAGRLRAVAVAAPRGRRDRDRRRLRRVEAVVRGPARDRAPPRSAAPRCVAARLFNVFGPARRTRTCCPTSWRRCARAGRSGSATSTRGATTSTRATSPTRSCGSRTYDGGETVFNVGTGVGTSVRELVRASARCSTLAPHRAGPGEACGPSSACTSSRTRRGARRELGWTPRLTLHDGLRDLVAHELAAVA
jgi:UDP-glucose 4-epimerase